jgi:hypothetical protein
VDRKTFRIVIEIEADALVFDVLRDALQGDKRIQRAMRLFLTAAIENVLQVKDLGALFVNVTGGRLENA